MRVTVSGFLGENRAVHPKLLPDGVGTVSLNHHPGRGDLRPWNAPGAELASVLSTRETIYRMGRDVASDTNFWLSWDGEVHVVRGFIADDTTERTYYTGDTHPKVTDNTMALTAPPYPSASRRLGIPAPATAPVVTPLVAGVSTSAEDRFYCYTYVSDWGEESAPSPPSVLLTTVLDTTATVGSFAAVPAGYTLINKIRVYRTKTGASGLTDFFFLREITGFGDTTDDLRDLGETLATMTWLPPNDDMTNLTGMWNGMMAGITGNAVRYCEPFTPYAWPVANETLPPNAKPVALGRYGQNLLVLTTGKPVLVTGSSPDSLDEQPLEIGESCVSSRSVVSFGHGVAWACPDGLMYFGTAGARMLTSGLMMRDDWQAINPASIVGTVYEGLYMGFYTVGGVTQGFLIDPLNPTGMYFLSTGYAAAYFDELQDQLYVLQGTSIEKWNAGAPMTTTFKSKTFRAPHPINMTCAEVEADNYPLTFKVYADGVLRHTQTVTSNEPFWLPSGYLASDWSVELQTTGSVQGCVLADDRDELRAV